jgi:hypothetical protein
MTDPYPISINSAAIIARQMFLQSFLFIFHILLFDLFVIVKSQADLQKNLMVKHDCKDIFVNTFGGCGALNCTK